MVATCKGSKSRSPAELGFRFHEAATVSGTGIAAIQTSALGQRQSHRRPLAAANTRANTKAGACSTVTNDVLFANLETCQAVRTSAPLPIQLGVPLWREAGYDASATIRRGRAC